MSETPVPRIVRDGKVAVILSVGYGGGWYSCNGNEEMLFDPEIVAMVENKIPTEIIRKYCREKYPEDYLGSGIENLKVYWIPEGDEFQIEEYNGKETIRLRKRQRWLKA